MILLISGPQGSGKSTLARAIAKLVWMPEPDIINELPIKKPGHLSLFTIATIQDTQELPKWILGRKDVVMIMMARIHVNSTELKSIIEFISTHYSKPSHP